VLSAIVLAAAAFGVSLLTLYTGFGLGTLLLPAFALFFPLPVAVAATAVVHVLNNLFKVGLLGRHVETGVLLRFGIPAVLCSFAGAALLTALAEQEPWHLEFLGRAWQVTPISFWMGLLIAVFALVDLTPAADRLRVHPRWLALGGMLSGFFGGLSGHQGALRAAFLAPLGLAPPVYVATQAVLACAVDFARLSVYGISFLAGRMEGLSSAGEWALVAWATPWAFAGAWVGARRLPGATLRGVRALTGALLLAVGFGLMLGLV